MIGIEEAMQAIADALEPITDEIVGLQVVLWPAPVAVPPCIDIYMASPFQVGAGFGVGSTRVYFTVRARASNADERAATRLLLRLLDPSDPASVEAAMANNMDPDHVATLDNDRGIVNALTTYADSPDMLGCDWTVGVFL